MKLLVTYFFAALLSATALSSHAAAPTAPAKVVKPLGGEAEAFHRRLAAKYLRLQHNHRLG